MKDIQFSFDTDRQRRKSNPWILRVVIIAVPLVMIVAALLLLGRGGDETGKTPAVPETESVSAHPVETPVAETAEPVSIPTPVPTPAATAAREPVKEEVVEAPAVPPEAVAEADKMIGNQPLDMVKVNGRVLSEILSEAGTLNQKHEYVQTRKLLEPLLKAEEIRPYSTPWLAVAEVLGQANIGLFFSDIPFARKVNHTVKRGDTLDRIANQYKTTIEGVQKSNRIAENSSVIRIGDNLRIYKGDWRILVSRSNHLLMLYDGDDLFKVYRVGIGKQERTPNGTFVISSKVKEPEWYAPDGRVIPFGNTDNLLGTRWLALQHTTESGPGYKGLGIHGTWQPETVGTNSSNGCVRMRNAEVEELYAIVPRLTPVEITD